MTLAERYKRVRETIDAAARRSGRDGRAVRIVAVTKTVGLDRVREAAALGLTEFGENRVREAAPKVLATPDLDWHFIGHLQSNKAGEVVSHYRLIHSLDRVSLARALQRCAEKENCLVSCLVQVNVAGEESKFGLLPSGLVTFLGEITSFDRLVIRGLMTMAPLVKDPEEARPVFRELRRLRDEAARPGRELPELSMGMTNDYPAAVEEGATIVRIGSALFG